MSVYLKSLANYPLSLRFNSGETRILGPGDEIKEAKDFEIQGNARIEKLKKQGLLKVDEAKPKAAENGKTAESAKPEPGVAEEKKEGETVSEPAGEGKRAGAGKGKKIM